MNKEKEALLCGLIDATSQKFLSDIDQIVSACNQKIDQDARNAGLHSGQDPAVDPQYLYAVLHRHCFDKLHQGDADVAKAIASNQSDLANTI